MYASGCLDLDFACEAACALHMVLISIWVTHRTAVMSLSHYSMSATICLSPVVADPIKSPTHPPTWTHWSHLSCEDIMHCPTVGPQLPHTHYTVLSKALKPSLNTHTPLWSICPHNNTRHVHTYAPLCALFAVIYFILMRIIPNHTNHHWFSLNSLCNWTTWGWLSNGYHVLSPCKTVFQGNLVYLLPLDNNCASHGRWDLKMLKCSSVLSALICPITTTTVKPLWKHLQIVRCRMMMG